VAATSYCTRRSAVDPDWRTAQLAAAADRARRCRELDPDAVRTTNRDSARRIRHRHAQTDLTFHELWRRVGGGRQTLAPILADELRAGRVEYRSTSPRYLLNCNVDAQTRAALRELDTVDVGKTRFADERAYAA
jgi:hypothetical protein